MMKLIKLMMPLALLITLFTLSTNAQTSTAKSRIIVIGAHPDDPDGDAAGTAALFASMGHAVKFLAVTNGDAGHHEMQGKPLAARRYKETQESAKRVGVTYDVLDNHDGLLMPTVDVRLQIIRKIREWQADVVIAPRPNDYHPDHRYTGVLVQDVAYMVAVPNIAPDVPALRKNPVFLYSRDRFQRPNPFRPDIVVDISTTWMKRMAAYDAHESQYYEWMPWIGHYLEEVPKDKTERFKWLVKRYDEVINSEFRAALTKWYGAEKAAKATYAEGFEICEYGAQPDEEEIRRLFPMLKK
jgi:LmbE family N-acetylglucosaminyl deacetylase